MPRACWTFSEIESQAVNQATTSVERTKLSHAFSLILSFFLAILLMRKKLVTSFHIRGLSPCFSRTETDPEVDSGSTGRSQTGPRRSQKLATDTRESMNERSQLNTPTTSTDELRGAQQDPGSTSNFFSQEASARLPDVKLLKIWSDQRK